jgi:hypothetical protein
VPLEHVTGQVVSTCCAGKPNRSSAVINGGLEHAGVSDSSRIRSNLAANNTLRVGAWSIFAVVHYSNFGLDKIRDPDLSVELLWLRGCEVLLDRGERK